MNILIVGLGEVGSHLAVQLAGRGDNVTVVDPSNERLERIRNLCDVKAIQGDGSRPDVLQRAEADRIKLVLAMSNDDNANMLCCLFARRMGVQRTVLRVKDLRPFEKFRRFFRANIGFDVVLSLEELAATEIVKAIRQNPAVSVESFCDGAVQLRRLKLDDDSSFVGKAVKDEKRLSGMVLCAIDRDREVIIPHGDDVFRAGDEISVLGFPDAVERFGKRAGLSLLSHRRIAMYGSGAMVQRVYEKLKSNATIQRITAIVPDKDAAGELSTVMEGPGVNVLHGDATDRELLAEEVADYDVFLGLAQVDELNLMSCLLARSESVRIARTLALTHKPDFVDLYQSLGVTKAVSPRLLCANAVRSYLDQGSKSTIAKIEGGQALIVELEVPKGSRFDGVPLRDMRFPPGSLVAAIAREVEDGRKPEVLVPNGDTVVRSLDNLVVFTLKSVADDVERLVLRGKR